jgi:DNA mismatch repair protein MutL
MPIAVLPPDVAAKIAAGEVVERPASIVKELVENALDAGARRIAVEVEAGGTNLIRVSDDGHGVEPAELPVAFLRHATSKLARAQDLSTVGTLGFRGEALPSIAAAADVDFASRTAGAGAGGRIRLSEGTVRDQTAYGGSRGTVVTVRDLFERQPVRRKFLRSPASEAAQISTVIGLYAIAYPEVGFTLTTDGRRTLVTSGGGVRREAVARVYGADTAATLLELTPSEDSGQAASTGGLISPPGLTRANRGYIHCFVNRRSVQPRRLTYSIEAAYESLLPSGRHPIAILDIHVPAQEVDVNVHPTKSEVRFLREREVQAAVYHSIRERLAGLAPATTPARAPSGLFSQSPTSSAPVQAPAMPLWRAITDVPNHDRPPAPATPAAQRPALPIMRVVGQAGSLYIVAEGPDGMYLLDQHAAHERVLYEQILRQRGEQGLETQGLLSPIAVDLTATQDAMLAEQAGEMREHGFEIEPFGPRSYLIRAIPSMLAGKDPGRALAELLDDLEDPGDATDRKTLITMTVACHSAVRAGKTMAMEEMRELLRQLEECELPRTCPHGRPTMIHLSHEALEHEFRRR